jgi:hypothetical protein
LIRCGVEAGIDGTTVTFARLICVVLMELTRQEHIQVTSPHPHCTPTCLAHFFQHLEVDIMPNVAETELPKENNAIDAANFILTDERGQASKEKYRKQTLTTIWATMDASICLSPQ